MAKKFIGNVKGVGVASIKKQYYLSTLASELTGGAWEDDVPAVGDANYLWSRWKVVLTDTTTEYTEAVQEGVAGVELESLANSLASLGTLLNEIAPGKTVNMAHGGTGASTAAEARQNINFIGKNPIASLEEDTTATWASLGTGVALVDADGVITNKPNSAGGFIFNQVTGGLVYQVWYGMNGSAMTVCYRAGNSNGWYESTVNWVKALNENNGVQMKKLWENAKPTSSFASQTVNVSAVDYDMFVVICKATTGATTYHKSQIVPKGKQALIQWTANDNNTTALMYCRRLITVSDSSISFTNCTSKQGSTVSDPNNSYLIPFAVYGIRGVQ